MSLLSTDRTESPAAAPADERPSAASRLSAAGRRSRLLAAAVAAVLLLLGTFHGSDDHFPFGPFRMYANANERDGLVRSSRVEGVNAEGERFKLTDAATGLRRAEIEGQLNRFREDGTRLRFVADAYHARRPDAPPLVLVEVLQRRYRLEDGQPTGVVTERQIAAWTAPGHEELADYDARIAAERREAEGRDAEDSDAEGPDREGTDAESRDAGSDTEGSGAEGTDAGASEGERQDAERSEAERR